MVCFILFCFLIIIKISYYYWSNRKDLLKKVCDKYHNKGGKEIAAIYYQKSKDRIKKKQRDKYKSVSKEEKDVIKERSLKRYYRLKEC